MSPAVPATPARAVEAPPPGRPGGPSRAAASRPGERGIALILTMLVLALLVILVTQFAWSSSVEEKVARNAKDDMKSVFAARGAISYVKAYLRSDRVVSPAVDSLREDWADPSMVGQAMVGDVSVQITLEDCERRLNVNLLADPASKDFALAVLKRLCGRLQMQGADELVDAIGDYVDTDTDGQYESGARNQALTHADELLAMPGLTPEAREMLVGKPLDPNTGTDPVPGILEFLTASGSKKVNINTMKLDLAWALLPDTGQGGTAIDRDAAITEIENYRTGGTGTGASGSASASASASASGSGGGSQRPGQDFNNVNDLQNLPGLAGCLGSQGNNPPGGNNPQGTTNTARMALRNYVDVSSQDFRLLLQTQGGASVGAASGPSIAGASLVKRYEVVLRRGRDMFDVLLWREVTTP